MLKYLCRHPMNAIADLGVAGFWDFFFPAPPDFISAKQKICVIHSIRVIRVQLCATLKINKSPTRKS